MEKGGVGGDGGIIVDYSSFFILFTRYYSHHFLRLPFV